MRSGEPLTDSDREPWLRRLAALLKQHAEHGQACVVACSALKRKYRNILSGHANMDAHTDQIAFVSSSLRFPGQSGTRDMRGSACLQPMRLARCLVLGVDVL